MALFQPVFGTRILVHQYMIFFYRQGSVIIVLELKYTMVLTLSNILTETQKIISDAKMDQNSQLTLLSIVDENSIVVKAYDGKYFF